MEMRGGGTGSQWTRPRLTALAHGASASGGIVGGKQERVHYSLQPCGVIGTYKWSVTNMLGGMGYVRGSLGS